jgi:hypothetical protein
MAENVQHLACRHMLGLHCKPMGPLGQAPDCIAPLVTNGIAHDTDVRVRCMPLPLGAVDWFWQWQHGESINVVCCGVINWLWRVVDACITFSIRVTDASPKASIPDAVR